MKQYYVNYSWVRKSDPSGDYGTFTGILSEPDDFCIKLWWSHLTQGNSGKPYYWTLNAVNRL